MMLLGGDDVDDDEHGNSNEKEKLKALSLARAV
jgi:hypothetical protein